MWMDVADKDKLFHMFINCYIMVRVVQRTMSNFLPKVMTCPKTVARIGIAPSVNYLFSSVDGRIVEKINSFTQRKTFKQSFTTRKLHDSRQFQYFKVIRLNKAEAGAVCYKISKSWRAVKDFDLEILPTLYLYVTFCNSEPIHVYINKKRNRKFVHRKTNKLWQSTYPTITIEMVTNVIW